MNNPNMLNAKTPGRTVWPWWASIGLVVLVAASLGVGGYQVIRRLTNTNARLEARLRDIEAQQKQGRINDQLALARSHQEALLATAREATNVLERLLADTAQLRADAAALHTNEAGSLIARHPDLVAQTRRFLAEEMPRLASGEDLRSRLEGTRRIGVQVAEKLGTAYEPAPELAGAARETLTWAVGERLSLQQTQVGLTTLVREARIKVAPATAPGTPLTLDQAIDQLTQTEEAAQQRLLAEKAAQARVQGAAEVAAAEAQRILEAARSKAAQLLSDAQAEAAESQRVEALKQAGQQVKDAQTQLAVQNAQEAARMVKLKKRASDPRIQGRLVPFTTPAFGQINGQSTEKRPHSLQLLRGAGALEPTMDGLKALAFIGGTPQDRERPRWKFNGGLRGWTKHPEEVQFMKEIQALLIELGPAMVELGLLQP